MLLGDFIKAKGMTKDSLYAKTKEGKQMTKDFDIGKIMTGAVNYIYGEDQAEDHYTKNKDAVTYNKGDIIEVENKKCRIIDIDRSDKKELILYAVEIEDPDIDYHVYVNKESGQMRISR